MTTKPTELEPELVLTGHGFPMRGPKMWTALHRLAREFDSIAVPPNAGTCEPRQVRKTAPRTATLEPKSSVGAPRLFRKVLPKW
jgi:hypothetical protein